MTSDWWHRKLLGSEPQPSSRTTSTAPVTTTNRASLPGEDVHIEYGKRHAQHSRQDAEECPSCGFEEYWVVGRVAGHPVKRCFDCGYPIEQQGSGISVPSSGPVQPARQVAHGGAGGASNYNPSQIIDRIG